MDKPNFEIIVGIDYSLSSSGVAALQYPDMTLCRLLSIPTKPEFRNRVPMIRWEYIAEKILYTCTGFSKPPLIFIEGYAFGAKGKVFDIAEGCGHLKYKIFQEVGAIPVSIPPSTVKQFVAGKGNATKEMVKEAIEFITGYVCDNTDQSDALAVAYCGTHIYKFLRYGTGKNDPKYEKLLQSVKKTKTLYQLESYVASQLKK